MFKAFSYLLVLASIARGYCVEELQPNDYDWKEAKRLQLGTVYPALQEYTDQNMKSYLSRYQAAERSYNKGKREKLRSVRVKNENTTVQFDKSDTTGEVLKYFTKIERPRIVQFVFFDCEFFNSENVKLFENYSNLKLIVFDGESPTNDDMLTELLKLVDSDTFRDKGLEVIIHDTSKKEEHTRIIKQADS